MFEPTKEYLEGFNQCGLEVGDEVIVTRSFKRGEGGWPWRPMLTSIDIIGGVIVGNTYTIHSIAQFHGCVYLKSVGVSYNHIPAPEWILDRPFPFFVLHKVDDVSSLCSMLKDPEVADIELPVASERFGVFAETETFTLGEVNVKTTEDAINAAFGLSSKEVSDIKTIVGVKFDAMEFGGDRAVFARILRCFEGEAAKSLMGFYFLGRFAGEYQKAEDFARYRFEVDNYARKLKEERVERVKLKNKILDLKAHLRKYQYVEAESSTIGSESVSNEDDEPTFDDDYSDDVPSDWQ
jgi:hypothetical protein